MKLTPKHIIYIAISNYITNEMALIIKTEIASHKRLTSQKFIELIEKYFDFKDLKDKPFIPEDVWLYNYLMFENQKKNKISFVASERIIIEGKFRVTELLRKYEKTIIVPQLMALKQAGKILGDSNI
jgi:hypothetical protein